jgi:hypothetical protein
MNKTLPRLVFRHLPRTGGTTLHHHLSAHFAPDQICPERFSRLERYSESQLEQWRFFSGHFNAMKSGATRPHFCRDGSAQSGRAVAV